jgi:hypothetical protein
LKPCSRDEFDSFRGRLIAFASVVLVFTPFFHSSMTLQIAIQGEERIEATSSRMAYAQPQFSA